MSRHDDDREGIGALDYGTAGFGAGQVLGRDAARRQQEILTGSEYSANMPPPGYRPGFDPEYLYFGEPRYEEYAALLPGVYGAAPAVPAAPAAPVPRIDATTGLPIGTLENLTQADADKAMELIASGQFDIDSLADQLELDRGNAFDAYNNYLLQTYGVGAYRPGTTLSDEDRKKYFDVANQFGFSPEQMSRIFGSTIDEARSGLAQQYFANIPVDQDYSADEAQQVFDLYKSGRMDVVGISNYFGITQEEVQSILNSMEGAGGAPAVGATSTPTPASPLSGIDVDGTYSDAEADQVYNMYVSGQVTPQEISSYFNIPLDEVNTALANIAQSRMPVAGVGSTTVRPQDVRSTDRGTGAVDPTVAEETEGADINPISTALDLYKSGVELPPEQIRETLEYAQSNNISFAQLDRMFGAPAGSAQNAAAALGMAARTGGIAGMAEGGEFPDLSGDGEVTQKDVLIGRGVIEKAEGGILSGIAGLFNKEEEPKPQGGALLTETESYLEAQRILSDPDSSDRDRAFAKGTLETLKPEQQGGNMDMNAYSLMMQQVDKILGATRNMQEGGYINRDELDSLIEMTRDAILGDAENADEIIQRFIAVFGNEAFQQLRETVLQSQVPNAQTEGMLEGQGGGMDDEINGMIGNQQPVAVSPGEYIIPADVVSSLGDGSSDAGADKLDKLLDDVRMEKTGTTVQPGKISDRVIPA